MNCSKLVKNDWEDATCSVCMECPHNAVLLLCSSHEKGCRPYMCGTSFRYSNCLDQYKKAYTKGVSPNNLPRHALLDSEEIDPLFTGSTWNYKTLELVCPLCRGHVRGCAVVELARAHLNTMKRTCVEDSCFFIGTYKELQKHVRTEHSSSTPLEINPIVEQKWIRMEREREMEDVMSALRSSNPGAVIHGDYVIGRGRYDFNSRNGSGFDAVGMESNAADVNHTLDGGSVRLNRRNHVGSYQYGRDHDGSTSLTKRLRRQGIAILGRSQRRRRQRAMNGDRRYNL